MRIFVDEFKGNFRYEIERKAEDFGFRICKDREKSDVRFLIDPINLNEIKIARDVIIICEPEVVRPDLYSKSFLSQNTFVLPLSRYRAERLGLSFWVDFPVELPTYTQRKLRRIPNLAIVNENKFSSSKRSQYGLRRKVIDFFENEFQEVLHLYGTRWNMKKSLEIRNRFAAVRNNLDFWAIDYSEAFSQFFHKYTSAVGHMHPDCELLQIYRASIVIENDLDYVSEKVWKSLYAGCPTIYVGPELKYDVNLNSCLFTAESNLESIISVFSNLNDHNEQRRSQAGLDFLHSANFNLYSADNRAIEFLHTIKKLLKF